jgi:hypothetical protein
VFWKRKATKVSINERDIASLTCPRCKRAGLEWDHQVFPSLMHRTDRGSVSKGQIGLLCLACNVGIVFDLINLENLGFEFERCVDLLDVPKNICLVNNVPVETLAGLKKTTQNVVFMTQLRVLERLIDTDNSLCWYSTAFGSLAGSAGYGVLRDGKLVAAMSVIQS